MASPSCFSDAVIISACIQPVKAENRAGKRGGSVVRYAQTDKKEGVVLLYLGLLLLAGILQGVMVSLNGQMGNYFSLFGICFFVHARYQKVSGAHRLPICGSEKKCRPAPLPLSDVPFIEILSL